MYIEDRLFSENFGEALYSATLNEEEYRIFADFKTVLKKVLYGGPKTRATEFTRKREIVKAARNSFKSNATSRELSKMNLEAAKNIENKLGGNLIDTTNRIDNRVERLRNRKMGKLSNQKII